MPSNRCRATVVVTCYNQAGWIEQALDAVAAQTERDVQLIITEDGSSDDSRETIERWIAGHSLVVDRVFSDVNVGLPSMLNRALALFTGDFLVIANGDDWMEPDRIERQADALEKAPAAVGLVYSDLRVLDETGQVSTHGDAYAGDRPEGHVLHRLIKEPFVGMPAVMFRREVLDEIGSWDESLVADDYDFLLRVAAAGFEFRYVPGVVTNYRWYAGNMTHTRQAALVEGRVDALRKLLGRDPVTDRAIYSRLQGLAKAMHSMGHARRSTRRCLREALLHAPSPGIARALLESHLHLTPGTLALRHPSAASRG